MERLWKPEKPTSTRTGPGPLGAVGKSKWAPPLWDIGDSLDGIPASFFRDILGNSDDLQDEGRFSGSGDGEGGGEASEQSHSCASDRGDAPDSYRHGSRFSSSGWEAGRIEQDGVRLGEQGAASNCNLVPVISAQHGESWLESEWIIDPYTLAVDAMDSADDLPLASNSLQTSASSSATTKKEDGFAAQGSECADGKLRLAPVKKISKRETLRRARDERAQVKLVKSQAKRDELVRKGVKCCDVVGCSEPRTASGRRICAVHKGAAELVLEGEKLIHRWCMHCYAIHPLSAFSPVSRTICAEKHELRKQRRYDRLNATALEAEEEPGEEPAEEEPSQYIGTAAVSSAEETGMYVMAHGYDVLDMKFGMHPAAIAAAENTFLWHAAAATWPARLFQPSRAGTPVAAAMAPGCTHLTISTILVLDDKAVGGGGIDGGSKDDSVDSVDEARDARERVIRMVATVGATELLRDKHWGLTVASNGRAGDGRGDVHCAAAHGGDVLSEHKGLLWPMEARPPLCIVADIEVVVNMSGAPQPVAVRWFGDGINAKSFAAIDATPPTVSCHVPPSSHTSILSVQMLVHGHGMGSEFQHILVLPSDDKWNVIFAREIEGLYNLTIFPPLSPGEMGAKERLRKLKLRRIVTIDLAWLLCAEESCAMYEDRTVVARALRIASGLRRVFTHGAGCPSLQRRLCHIEQDLLNADAHTMGDGEASLSDADGLSYFEADVADDDRHSNKHASLATTTEISGSLESKRVGGMHGAALLVALGGGIYLAIHYYTVGPVQFIVDFAFSSMHNWIFWMWVVPVAISICAMRALYKVHSRKGQLMPTTGSRRLKETTPRTLLMESLCGFHLKSLETKFQAEKLQNANAVLPKFRMIFLVLTILYHFKVMNGSGLLPSIVVHDCTIAFVIVFFTSFCAHLFHTASEVRVVSGFHPYDGLVTACFFHLVYVQDALVFFTREGAALYCYAFLAWCCNLLLAVAYGMQPVHYWAMCAVTSASSALKIWIFSDRWPVSEFARVIDFQREAMQFSAYFALWTAVTSFVVLGVEHRHRRRFITNGARKLHHE